MGAELLVPGGVLVALISGALTYLGVRRKSSGTIDTSESKELWDANNAYVSRVEAAAKEFQDRANAELEKLRGLVNTLTADFLVADRKRIDCEGRITILESTSAAAVIIETAKKEAATIRFEATKAAELLQNVANEAAVTVKKDAAAAKQVVKDAKAKP